MTSWLLVANSRHAKVYEIESARYELKELADFAHPAPAKHGSNPGGSVFASRNGARQAGTRHGQEPQTSPKTKETQTFAADLAHYLEDELAHRHFSELTLAASPELLGELRMALPDGVRKLVKQSLDKDLTAYSDSQLTNYLREKFTLH